MAAGQKALGLLLALCPSAFALNPALDISQYAHTAWTIREGFFDSAIQTIAQTPDGYLWLGTELGLLRFDGVQRALWQPPSGEHLPSTNITKLLVTRDGRLWIGTRSGLASWKDGILDRYPELDGQMILALLEDGGGTLWAGGGALPTSKLCAIRRGVAQCYGQDGSFGNGIESLFEENGNIWVGAVTGLWRWKPGPAKRYAMPSPYLDDLNKAPDGPLLVAMPGGVRQFAGEKAAQYPIPGATKPYEARRLLRDRDGGLWIGTIERGLLHVHQGKTDQFNPADGLSGDDVNSIFEDREGNVWVATLEGLDRFREFAVPVLASKQGFSANGTVSVLSARDGSIWVGAVGGLNRWKDGKVVVYGERDGLPYKSTDSLFEDDQGRIWVSTLRGIAWFNGAGFVPLRSAFTAIVSGIVEGVAGSFWISDRDQGLIHLLNENVVDRIPWPALGRQDYATALVRDPKRDGLWLGFYQGGVLFLKDGKVEQSYGTAQGLGAGRVWGVQLQPDDSLWVSTDGGLSRIRQKQVVTLNSRNGLPCDSVFWAVEDDEFAVWLYTACGLARIDRAELDASFANPNRLVKKTVFGGSDGVRLQTSTSGYSPQTAKLPDGRIFFATHTGLSVIDPKHLTVNKLPPPVHIEKIISDREVRWQSLSGAAASKLRLPALSRDLQIDFTALSFVAPEKNQFKYKLEGYDRDWQDAGNRRQAFYTNLSPRSYRFRVIASNNSGLWNEAGDTLDFSIAPAYYQATWFRASLVGAFIALLAALYQLRLRYLKHQFDIGLEARVGERTRIARDLHDTLLQSFQGVLLKFHAVTYMLSDRPEARTRLEGVIDQARAAVTEGRDAVQGLRSSTLVNNDLAQSISIFGDGLVSEQTNGRSPTFRIQVEGASRELIPLVRDEVYRITIEALRNAFRHAGARRIEIEIHYDRRQLQLRIRDDGKGIDPKVLSEGGRAGHHGLPGLHERAKLAGGKLSVWSKLGSGTEIELTIPASIAYSKPPRAGRAMPAGTESA